MSKEVSGISNPAISAPDPFRANVKGRKDV